MSTQPVLLVRPFQNLSGKPDLDFWGIGLASELTAELARYPDVQVIAYRSSQRKIPEGAMPNQFTIDGSVRTDHESIKVTVQLTDTETGLQIWGDSLWSEMTASKLIDFQEEIARRVAVITAGAQGVIAKSIAQRADHNRPKHDEAYEALLSYFEYDLKMTPGSFQRAFSALNKAIEIESDYGCAYCMLARMYADIYALDVSGYDRPLDKAVECARKGMGFAPDDQRSMVIMAYIHLLRNDLHGGLAEANRAFALSPNTLFVLECRRHHSLTLDRHFVDI